ncbi:hypothetical protein CDL15_Pgr016820 [Punica granatum]|uniref:Uncharacterized protein n=1 Tax=Punica granatum TaxID=22663 RepID=A0A218WXP8_PUNGR|nr:hypothetical protein CDL15_Pgr016820 [Punica granatum]
MIWTRPKGEVRGLGATTTARQFTHQPEDGGSSYRAGGTMMAAIKQLRSWEDYTKFTVLKLKQELRKHNFGAELLQLKKPSKKDILSLYEKGVVCTKS